MTTAATPLGCTAAFCSTYNKFYLLNKSWWILAWLQSISVDNHVVRCSDAIIQQHLIHGTTVLESVLHTETIDFALSHAVQVSAISDAVSWWECRRKLDNSAAHNTRTEVDLQLVLTDPISAPHDHAYACRQKAFGTSNN
eukprot:GHUV01041193.1.p1 GENE.GHUV01041193.1~~GHUV01041193.1.p1  ORF type:complete len:156 (-),score=13.76 GHUV01041193.1:937-1356(-)